MLARIPILPVEIYRSIAVYPPEWGFATTLSVVLLLITSLLIYGQNKILAGKSFVTVTGKETMDRTRLGIGAGLPLPFRRSLSLSQSFCPISE